MSFFDNIGNAVAGGIGKAATKGNEAVAVMKLNSAISEEEKKINNSYNQIGRLYVSMHRLDHELEFDGLISAINEGEQKIADWRKQVQDIKGVQRCAQCGAEVPKGSSFCSTCGAPMMQSQPSQMYTAEEFVRCGKCGAMVKKGMNFCSACGSPIVMDAQTVPEAVPETPVKEMERKICPNCGTDLDEDATFCTECGTQL